MFKNQQLEELYKIASPKDVTHTIDAYLFILENVETLTNEELELIKLLTNMYTDVPSVSREVSNFIRSIVQFNIKNIDEIMKILEPYQKCMEERNRLGQPLSFQIRHTLNTDGLSKEHIENRERFCTLNIFLVQLSSNLTLTNEHKNFCIHSNVFDDIEQNGKHDNTDFLENVIIDLSKCETATVGYLCQHWLYTEYQKGRIIPNPELKHLIEYFYGNAD